jgi:LacI family transcriptional regulator
MDPLDEAMDSRSPFAKLSYTIDDSDGIGRAAADYFTARGYRNYAYFSDPLNRNWSIRRGKSFEHWVKKAGHTCHIYCVKGAPGDRTTEERLLADWLIALPKPAALLAAMDTCAQYLVEVCVDIGLRIPQDIAVLGIDNDELICNGSSPTLSSIRRDTEACGFMAAQMLDSLMRRETRKRKVMLYGVKELVTRDSTQPHAIPNDPIVRRAKEFIRINAGTNICIPDIIRHLGVSRRLAEMRFRSECGKSLHDEIQNARLDRAEKLLKETNLKLSDISIRCGYQTDVNLRRFFKHRYGYSMRQYRKLHKGE